MSKKDEFKEFALNNKYLQTLVNSGKYSWQDLYETYDIYGTDSEIWSSYKTKTKKETSSTETVKNLFNNLKNIDTDKLEENITSLQKALGFLEEIVSLRTEKKEEKKETNKKKKSTEIERFFDD